MSTVLSARTSLDLPILVGILTMKNLKGKDVATLWRIAFIAQVHHIASPFPVLCHLVRSRQRALPCRLAQCCYPLTFMLEAMRTTPTIGTRRLTLSRRIAMYARNLYVDLVGRYFEQRRLGLRTAGRNINESIHYDDLLLTQDARPVVATIIRQDVFLRI